MIKFDKWEIWKAEVEFEESKETKSRPVLIIPNKENKTTVYVEALKITSHSARRFCEGEYQIMKWKEAGLPLESVVRCSKPLKLHDNDFIKKYGRLQATDIIGIQQLINYMNL